MAAARRLSRHILKMGNGQMKSRKIVPNLLQSMGIGRSIRLPGMRNLVTEALAQPRHVFLWRDAGTRSYADGGAKNAGDVAIPVPTVLRGKDASERYEAATEFVIWNMLRFYSTGTNGK